MHVEGTGAWPGKSGLRSSIPWRVVGVGDGSKRTPFEPLHAGVDQLLAQVWRPYRRGTDCRALRAEALDQPQNSGGPTVSSGSPGRRPPHPSAIRGTPPGMKRSRGWSGAASMRTYPQQPAAPCQQPAAPLANSLRRPCQRPAAAHGRSRACVDRASPRASASGPHFRAPSATTAAVEDHRTRGSFRRPRWGASAPDRGASVLDQNAVGAGRRARWRANPPNFLNVTTPEKREIERPRPRRSPSASSREPV